MRFPVTFILPSNVHNLPYYQHSVPDGTFVRTEKPPWTHYNHQSLWFMLGFTFVLYIWLGVHRCKMACDHLVLAQNTLTAFRGGACKYWLSQGFHLRTYYLGFHGRVFFLIDIWYNLIIIKFTSAEYVLMNNWHVYSHVYIVLSCYQTFVPFPKFPYAPLVYHFPTADLFPVIIVLELFFFFWTFT